MHREEVGVPLRRALQETLLTLREPAVLIIDGTGVREMAGSVAEEIGPCLFATFQSHRQTYPETYLIYDNLSPDTWKELDAWFTRYGWCVPAFRQDDQQPRPPLMGVYPPANLVEVLAYCYAHGVVDSVELEQHVTAASKKLIDVQRHYAWLLRRHGKVRGDTPRSWRYQFLPITPWDRAG
jgi:hypothetical protein